MQLGYPPYEGCKLQLRITLLLFQCNYEKAVPLINVPQPTPTSSMASFSPPNSPNPKDLQLNIMYVAALFHISILCEMYVLAFRGDRTFPANSLDLMDWCCGSIRSFVAGLQLLIGFWQNVESHLCVLAKLHWLAKGEDCFVLVFPFLTCLYLWPLLVENKLMDCTHCVLGTTKERFP